MKTYSTYLTPLLVPASDLKGIVAHLKISRWCGNYIEHCTHHAENRNLRYSNNALRSQDRNSSRGTPPVPTTRE